MRQAVLAAEDLEAVAGRLREELSLGESFSDPGVEHFGLRNAVFALGDSFLEVVSPISADTAAGRLLRRRGGDCGYMVMFQVDDLEAARERARAQDVREVFEVALEDIAEVHLHPADMRGAIVSLSHPEPRSAWRWGGPEWEQRSAPGSLLGATIAVGEPDAVGDRWRSVIGGLPGIGFRQDDSDPGLVELAIATGRRRDPVQIAGVRFVFVQSEEDR